ncbi:hypothetical protein VSR34_21485 [Paraburkholderia sp. JHI2823]|uniref:hypothetical protein n=1 Tax=Paraburkholderia sp. JHI2823 TaxID=3112960 RepID=UPI00317DA30B
MPWDGQSLLFEVDGKHMLADASLSEEVFGPTSLLVRVADVEQLIALARQFRGQLSATSNFPIAYSVAGGDTASALAAGCPVTDCAKSRLLPELSHES